MHLALGAGLLAGLLCTATAQTGPSGQLRFVDVSVNGVRVAEAAPVWYDGPPREPRTRAAQLWLETGLLREHGLGAASQRQLAVAAREFGDACAVPPVVCYFDEAQQRLSLWAPPEHFQERALSLARAQERAELLPPVPGALLSYELALSESRGQGPALLGLGEFSAFGGSGLLAGLWRGQFSLSLQRGRRELLPFGLQHRLDEPAAQRTRILGQTLSMPLPGRPSFAYTGVRWATQFALDPLQPVQATPRFSGRLDSPSSVDVYVDGFRRSSERFDFGRFALETPVGAAGASDITVVVRDASGQLRSTERLSYYFSPTLLRPGLVERSVEAGFAARDSFRYRGSNRRPFAAYSERRGWRDDTTLQATVQLGQPLQRAGLGFTHTLLNWATLDAMAVLERAGGGPSAQRQVLGLERSAGALSFTLRSERASRVLEATPDRIGLSSLRRLTLLSASQGGGSAWTGPLALSATLLRQESGAGVRASGWQLGLQARPQRQLGLGLYLRRDDGPRRVDTLGLTLNLSLDAGLSASGEWRRRDGGSGLNLSAQRLSLGTETQASDFVGLARAPEGDSLLAHVERERSEWRWRASAYRQPGFHLVQAAVAGAVGRVGGVGFRSRRVSDAFAVVRVDPYPDVSVFFNNRLVGRTNAAGLLVLPAVPSHLPQTVGIDANALPVETAVPQPERLLMLRAGQGALIDFEVATSASVTVRLVDARGEPLPPGQPVRIAHLREPSYLGRRGMLYIERAEPEMRASARLADGRRCVARIPDMLAPAPPGTEPAFVCMPLESP